tara:strand:- start:389 stop:526 length:138 start_codon:yes stop_codon:yes gene_type:complete
MMLCSTVPDGIVAFFTSYSYMEKVIIEVSERTSGNGNSHPHPLLL